VDPSALQLRARCEQARRARRQRIERLAERLTAQGLPGSALASTALAAPTPTRQHLARALCAQGFAASISQAFERYLLPRSARGAGRQAPEPPETAQWPQLEALCACIESAGGVAVLAHPHRYGFSGAALNGLVQQFKGAGGTGLEVSLPGMSPAQADLAARLARRWDLAGSIGSDFHDPGLPWRPLGRFAKLADAIRPITASLEGRGTL
jgi:predicted metal-dependent phosphoesterase TrpH